MSTELKYLGFWFVVYGGLWLLRRHPRSLFAKAAFTWIGPLPVSGESWSRFQFRWSSYSFGWLTQFSLALSLLAVAGSHWPASAEATWFKVLFFALPLGIGIALLATVGFAIKALKAAWVGPNPTFEQGHGGPSEA